MTERDAQPDPSPEARAAATELFGKMFARNCTTEQIATIIDRHFAEMRAVVEAAKNAHAWVAGVYPNDLSRAMIELGDALDALEARHDQR